MSAQMAAMVASEQGTTRCSISRGIELLADLARSGHLYSRERGRGIAHVLEQNYTSAELYATTWGDTWGAGNVLDTYSTMHTCANLMYLRKYVEAVMAYTGAPKLDVIAHSLGVPMAR